MNEPVSKEITARLRRLESRQRRTYVAAGCGLALLLAAMVERPQDVVDVSELRVVHDGAVRVRLGVEDDGAASIVMQDPSGTRRVALVAPLDGPSRIEFFGADGTPQPLLSQIADEADTMASEKAREIEREVHELLDVEVERLRDALSTWKLHVLGEPEQQPHADGQTLVMRIVAEDGDADLDLPEQARRLRAFLAETPDAATDPAAIARFHSLPPDAGGPTTNVVRWVPHVIRPSKDDPARWELALSRHSGPDVVVAFDDAAWNGGRVAGTRTRLIEYVPVRMNGEAFTGADLDPGSIRAGLDEFGRPAIQYRMSPERQQAFGDWSEANVHRLCAIVIDGRVVSAPRFISRISGAAQITGEFSPDEAEDLVRRLRRGAR